MLQIREKIRDTAIQQLPFAVTPPSETTSVWLFDDGRDGHRNQSLGLIEALGLQNTSVVPFRKRRFGNQLRFIKRQWRWHVPSQPYPDIVVGAGKASGLILPEIKARSPRTFTIQLMSPVRSVEAYDVVLPHANTGPYEGSNVFTTATTLHRSNEARRSRDTTAWREAFAGFKGPFISVLIGGAAGGFPSDEIWAPRLIEDVIARTIETGGTLLVTTSRRSPEGMAERLEAEAARLGIPAFVYDPNKAMDSDGTNPFFALLGFADEIIVSADSMSMASEACAGDKPVYIWGRDYLKRPKFKLFHQILRDLNRAADLREADKVKLDLRAINDTHAAAEFVKERYIAHVQRWQPQTATGIS